MKAHEVLWLSSLDLSVRSTAATGRFTRGMLSRPPFGLNESEISLVTADQNIVHGLLRFRPDLGDG